MIQILSGVKQNLMILFGRSYKWRFVPWDIEFRIKYLMFWQQVARAPDL